MPYPAAGVRHASLPGLHGAERAHTLQPWRASRPAPTTDASAGRRPVLACGNSDGDFEMLEGTTTGPGLRLGLILRHDDPDREFACERGAPVGRLDRGLDEAPARGWVVTSMKSDGQATYPPVAQ